MHPEAISSCIPAASIRARRRGSLQGHAYRRTRGDYRNLQGEGRAPEQALHNLSAGDGRQRTAWIREGENNALRPDGEATAADVSGAVHTGGPIARLGQRLIGGVAKMIMDRFFACLKGKIEAPHCRAALRRRAHRAASARLVKTGYHGGSLCSREFRVDVRQSVPAEPRGGRELDLPIMASRRAPAPPPSAAWRAGSRRSARRGPICAAADLERRGDSTWRSVKRADGAWRRQQP